MENVTRALIMAFSMLIFVIGLAYSMFLINKLTTTSKVLLESVTTTNYYDNIKVSSADVAVRDVGVDTIIPVLYRYYNENYAVRIYDKDNNLIQVFDLNLENQIYEASAYSGTSGTDDKTKIWVALKNSDYNKPQISGQPNKIYLFGAPWVGDKNKFARIRIDYFLNGKKGYINNTLVDYTPIEFLKNYGGKTFQESFVEYAYTGDTLTTEERFRNNNW